jgi:hypothetical protein
VQAAGFEQAEAALRHHQLTVIGHVDQVNQRIITQHVKRGRRQDIQEFAGVDDPSIAQTSPTAWHT